jgi:hypothetical protein
MRNSENRSWGHEDVEFGDQERIEFDADDLLSGRSTSQAHMALMLCCPWAGPGESAVLLSPM